MLCMCACVHVCMVTDNGRNIHAAVHQMEWTQLQCMVHLVQHLDVQLVIKDAREVTPAVSLLCKKAWAIVGHYKHNTQATWWLKNTQKCMEPPSTSLVQDVDTRWNSEHAMLSQLVQLKDTVDASFWDLCRLRFTFPSLGFFVLSKMLSRLKWQHQRLVWFVYHQVNGM